MYIYNLGLLFYQVARENKERVAIWHLDSSTSDYRELDELSNKIAYSLLEHGIKKLDVVAIFNNKSTFSFAIMLACLKIGAVYTNIDPNSPVIRIHKMLDVCKPGLIFDFRGKESKYTQYQSINYTCEHFIEEVSNYPGNRLTVTDKITGDTPAYIMFTSGSTGFPKGVIISHSNVINFIKWSVLTFSIQKQDVFTNINPLHFDNSVFDFYSSVFTGASLIPVSEDLTRNPRRMIDVLNKLSPTIWFSVPSMLVYALKMRAIKNNDLSSLRIISFGGEGFPKSQLRVLWSLLGHRITFINVYGPTECTCICSSYVVCQEDMEKSDLLPLGPIALNFSFMVLDDHKKAVVDGTIGELYIGGPNVGLGYFNNTEKTEEVFIQNPLVISHKEIIYKSGDLVTYDKQLDSLYFCGRKDNQVKKMGYRIELEEIEMALGSLPYITENAVIYHEVEDEIGKIIACVCPSALDENNIINDLAAIIPAYMMPGQFHFFEHLPKNLNGKIDKLTLKESLRDG